MRRTRKEPRLNLRFKDHDELDELELLANRQGMKLSVWMKSIARNALKNDSGLMNIESTSLKSILVVRKIVEDQASKDDVKNARSHVDSYLSDLKSYAAR